MLKKEILYIQWIYNMNRLIRIIYNIFLFTLLGFFLNCGKNVINTSDRWEGIKIYKLRVYVRLDNHDIIEKNKLTEMLIEAGNKRAIHLLTGYVVMNVKDKPSALSFNDLVMESAKNGKIFYRNCDDSYCEAFIDYKIKDFILGINEIEKTDWPWFILEMFFYKTKGFSNFYLWYLRINTWEMLRIK